jgi:hypothetical protein
VETGIVVVLDYPQLKVASCFSLAQQTRKRHLAMRHVKHDHVMHVTALE